MEKEKKITMQYPYDSLNPTWDGREHVIEPIDIIPIKIKGRQFFILIYFDHTTNTQSITLVTIINGRVVKCPLNDYSILNEILNNDRLIADQLSDYLKDPNNIRLLDLLNNILTQGKIPLGQLMQSKYLFDDSFSKEYKSNKYAKATKDKPVYDFELYVTTDPYGGSVVERRMFSPHGILDHNNAGDDSIQEYKYSKSCSCNLITNPIKHDLYTRKTFVNKNSNNYDYEFEVEIPEGTIGYEELETRDGRMLLLETLMIPGTHRYHVVYGKCEDLADYKNSGKAEKVIVYATRKQLKDDLHDTPKAFRLGCAKDLPMRLYDSVGRELKDQRRSYR